MLASFLESPYQVDNWNPKLSSPALELANGVFTSVLSVDSSKTPYDLVITYGLEKYVGEDRRARTGQLYARRFRGEKWLGEALLLSEPDTIHDWYPNVNQDARDGLCIMYSRNVDQKVRGAPLAVMVSVVQ